MNRSVKFRGERLEVVVIDKVECTGHGFIIFSGIFSCIRISTASISGFCLNLFCIILLFIKLSIDSMIKTYDLDDMRQSCVEILEKGFEDIDS